MQKKITLNKKYILPALLFTMLSAFMLLLFPSMMGVPVVLSVLVADAFMLATMDLENNKELQGLLAFLVAFVCLLGCFCITELLANGSVVHLLKSNIKAILYGLLILLVPTFVLYALSNSLPFALRGTAIIALAYGLVSYFVFTFRGTMFTPLDIFGVGTALAVIDGYDFQFTKPLAQGVMLFTAIFLLAGKATLPEFKRGNGSARFTALLLALAVPFATLTRGFFYNQGWSPNYWDQSVSAYNNGSIVNFVGNIPYAIVPVPSGYSPEAAAQIAANYMSDSADMNAEMRPDIIVILGESWANLPDTTDTNIPVLPFVNSFQNRSDGIYRDLMVSGNGGGTALSEFQLLTGASAGYEGVHSSPFQFSTTQGMPSLPAQLSELGYETTALHTGEHDAWNRDIGYPMLGFDNYYTNETLVTEGVERERYYPADSVMYDYALSILEDAEGPQFIYCVTLHTHGGYTDESYDSPVEINSPEGNYPQAEQYFGLLNSADQDLEEFIEEISQRERPTIVLVFGDHLPGIEKDYLSALQTRWVNANPSMTEANSYNYETFFVMWANFEMDAATQEISQRTSVNYLGAYIMQAAGLPLTGYQKFLLYGAQEMPVTSVSAFVDKGGTFMYPNHATSLQIYKDQSIIQYNLLKDTDNYPQGFYNYR